MGDELVLYEGDEEDDKIEVELTSGYDVMFSELEEESDGNTKAALCRVVEQLIHQEIQNMAVQDDEIHRAYARLVIALEHSGEIDTQSVVESAIHELQQRA